MTERTAREAMGSVGSDAFDGDIPTIGSAALRGAAAALVGGLAMKAVWSLSERTLPEGDRLGSPTRAAVDRLAGSRGLELSGGTRTAATLGLFAAAMATWGAVYGSVQNRLHPPFLAHGLLLGGLLYASNLSSATPLAKSGAVRPFRDQNRRQRIGSVGSHAAFGLATAAAFEALS